jgi:O-antigen ligase/tetratricopeptide (TPR) repeat protein
MAMARIALRASWNPQPASCAVGAIQEAVLLVLVALSPWALGSSEPIFEFLAYCFIALLVVLWAIRALLERQFALQRCPVTMCLVLVFLLGVLQLVVLPRPVLTALSPSTVRLFDTFLPQEPEQLAGDDGDGDVPWTAGASLSLYPGVTRRALVRVLAVLLLFLVVRNGPISENRVRRLCWLCLVNGSLLAFFGLYQRVSSPDDHMLYGAFPVEGNVFGPFVYRNYFACYINLCMGATAGLFLAAGSRSNPVVGEATPFRGPPSVKQYPARGPTHSNHARLWIGAALVIMAASLVVCQSRGGVIVLGLVTGLLVSAQWKRIRWRQFAAGFGIVVAVAAVLAWIHFDWSTTRLRSVFSGAILHDSRAAIWLRVLPLVGEYPLWGTGSGTFPYVEQPFQTHPLSHVVDYAHNEYLEGLIEGGLLRLGLTLLAVILVARCAHRVLRGTPAGALHMLSLGLWLSLLSIFIYSIFDFVFHLPAIVILATVLCGYLCALDARAERSIRLPGVLGALIGSIALIIPAGIVVAEGWYLYEAQHWLLASVVPPPGHVTVPVEAKIASLERAVKLLPTSERLHVLLAETHLEQYEQGLLRRNAEASVYAAITLLSAPVMPVSAGPLQTVGVVFASSLLATKAAQAASEALAQAHIPPALRHYVQARNLCPLVAKPHVRIAANLRWFQRAEPRSAHLDRAKRLLPADEQLWYLCGVQELLDGQSDQAWRSWRHCLDLSDRYLAPILARSAPLLAPSDLIDRILPEDPRLLLAAAQQLYPQPEQVEQRRPYLERALALLPQPPATADAKQLYLRATIQRAMGQSAEALASYRLAVLQSPWEINWRYEWAELLYQQGKREECRRELLIILGRQPGYSQAQALWKMLADPPDGVP